MSFATIGILLWSGRNPQEDLWLNFLATGAVIAATTSAAFAGRAIQGSTTPALEQKAGDWIVAFNLIPLIALGVDASRGKETDSFPWSSIATTGLILGSSALINRRKGNTLKAALAAAEAAVEAIYLRAIYVVSLATILYFGFELGVLLDPRSN